MPCRTFVGFVLEDGEYRKRADLFELISVNKASDDNLDVIARCRDVITLDDMNILKLHEDYEFVRQFGLVNHPSMLMHIAEGCKFTIARDTLTDQNRIKLRSIHQRMSYFLSVLRARNPRVYELLKIRLNNAFTDTTISYCWEQSPFEYLSFCASLLDMIKAVYAYLENTEPGSDPARVFSRPAALDVKKRVVLCVFVCVLVFAVYKVFSN